MNFWQLLLILALIFLFYLVWRVMGTNIPDRKIRFFKLLVGLDILLSVILFVVSFIHDPFENITLTSGDEDLLVGAGIVTLPVWIANLCASVGLLMLKNWARYLYLATAIFILWLNWSIIATFDLLEIQDVPLTVLVLAIIFISFFGKVPFGLTNVGASRRENSHNLNKDSLNSDFTEDVKSKKEMELRKVEEMFTDGSITEDERNKLRAKILGID